MVKPKIFIGYRRQDTGDQADRIFEKLKDEFGEGSVFIDVDDIPPGADFAKLIHTTIANCQVFLALIGPNWLTISDETGAPRINDPDDLVRKEIHLALGTNSVAIIPVLVNNAAMPKAQHLPKELHPLLKLNSLPIRRNPDFQNDISRLTDALKQHLNGVPSTFPSTFSNTFGDPSSLVFDPETAKAFNAYAAASKKEARKQKARLWTRRAAIAGAASAGVAGLSLVGRHASSDFRMRGFSELKEFDHGAPILTASINRNKQNLITSDIFNTILWDIEAHEKIKEFSAVAKARFSRNGQHLTIMMPEPNRRGYSLTIVDATNGMEVGAVTALSLVPSNADLSPDGKKVVFLDGDGRLVLVDLHSGRKVSSSGASALGFRNPRFSPDGQIIIASLPSGNRFAISLLDSDRLEQITNLTGHESTVLDMDLSSDARHLVSASADRTIRLWDVRQSKEIAIRRLQDDFYSFARFNNELGKIVAFSQRNYVIVYDEGLKGMATLRGHVDRIEGIAASKNRSSVVTWTDGLKDTSMRLWRYKAGENPQALRLNNHRTFKNGIIPEADGFTLLVVKDNVESGVRKRGRRVSYQNYSPTSA